MDDSSDQISRLRDLLHAYDAGADEAQAVVATLELIEAGSATMSADHYVPGHVTASAFVIDPSHSRLLLIHHAKLDRWMQPGGHIDAGEDVLAAAIREVEEETGVVGVPLRNGIFDLDIHRIPAHGDRPAHQHFDVRFLLAATSEELVRTDEVLGVRWVPITRVHEVSTDQSVVRATGKLRRPRPEQDLS